MTEITAPVALAGPGSQPLEADGAELDILQMPSGMDTYLPPPLPEPEEIEDLQQAKRLLHNLLAKMAEYQIGQPPIEIDLGRLDAANRELVDQVLGEGEVSLRVTGACRARIQESVLAGVWRVKYLAADDSLLRDVIEVAGIPGMVTELTFATAQGAVDSSPETIPEGVLNAPPLIAEINDKISGYRVGDMPHVINLTLLPQTGQDLVFLADRLGEGGVTILSRGYGNCRITSTATKNVWWVQYFNSQDNNILNSLEITQVPSVACAAAEDLHDSALRLAEIMEIYR